LRCLVEAKPAGIIAGGFFFSEIARPRNLKPNSRPLGAIVKQYQARRRG